MKIILCFTVLLPIFLLFLTHEISAQEIEGRTYTIYGGNNLYDSIAPDWTAGSDNVVWDFGQTGQVYRLLKSLSLRYNPNGEFHIIRSTPLDTSNYIYLSLVGRSNTEGYDFKIAPIDQNNQILGRELRFADYGGRPHPNYWIQYNFPVAHFALTDPNISGFRITQESNGWGAAIYIDEIYLSDLRGEDINPAVPTPTPSTVQHEDPQLTQYLPEVNPLFLIPILLLGLAIFMH